MTVTDNPTSFPNSPQSSHDSASSASGPKTLVLETLVLDLTHVRKGVDNYHIDVRLSPKFSNDVRRVSTALLTQVTSPTLQAVDNSRLFTALRNSYGDLITMLIHRVKTDLDPATISLLELAVLKFILVTTRAHFDELIDKLKENSTATHTLSSANALTTNQRLFWLQKNYDAILFSINSQLFSQLERVETRQLRDVRAQHLPEQTHDVLALHFNPILFSSEPGANALLIDQYRLWGGDGEDAGFNVLNADMERLLEKQMPELPTPPFLTVQSNGSPELYDELGGLFQTQKFMGMAVDLKSVLAEDFSWLDIPENLLIFYVGQQSEALRTIRKESGFAAWWRARTELNRRKRVLLSVIEKLKKRGVFALMIASKHVSNIWSPTLAEQVEARVLCQYLSGQIDARKLQSRTLNGNLFVPSQLKQFDVIMGEIKHETGAGAFGSTLAILNDLSRFRLHLKYYRFAHRAFNRVQLLKLDNEIALSTQAGTLYTILTASETKDDQNSIVHHAVIKADVRGSTTVTDELLNKSLNPASYFSLRFFSPINKLLPLYGANKVFIEGDAVILSFLEHGNSPQQWFAVARACGLAKAMLNIVHANNLHSEKMGLPKLELGIGLCYSAAAPHYLFDEDKPIMISGAIGKADRLSSCTWKLRRLIQPSVFNVEVYALADGESSRGEKGQNTIRYNVNGVLMDSLGFAKLQEEISLRKLTVKINTKTVTLHVGKYPDVTGKSHDIVIREAPIGLWRDDAVVEGHDTGETFFEVVTNRKLIAQVCSSS